MASAIHTSQRLPGGMKLLTCSACDTSERVPAHESSVYRTRHINGQAHVDALQRTRNQRPRRPSPPPAPLPAVRCANCGARAAYRMKVPVLWLAVGRLLCEADYSAANLQPGEADHLSSLPDEFELCADGTSFRRREEP